MTVVAPLRVVPEPDRADAERTDLLRSLLHEDFVSATGWDPDEQVFAPARDHPLLGLRKCVVVDCQAGVRTPNTDLCKVCVERFKSSGLTLVEFAARPCGKKVFGQRVCPVEGCERLAKFACGLCPTHRAQWRRTDLGLEFVQEAQPIRRPALTCEAAACSRLSESRTLQLCANHRLRWWNHRNQHSCEPDYAHWLRTVEPINADHFVIFKGLADVVQLEVLVALQARTDAGTRTLITGVRAIVAALRRTEATSIYDLAAAEVAGLRHDAGVLLRSLRDLLGLRMSTPETERDNDVWDLRVFGFGGNLVFTDISQPWLLETAKRWAEDDLPQHRGRQGGGTAKYVVAAVAMLSESLHQARPDHGTDPVALSRRDVVALMNRLAYLERTGEITAKTRLARCRYLKRFLHDIRVLGLTRPAGPAAGLHDDFHLGRNDIPAEPVDDQAGRDVPAWVLAIICDNLGLVETRSGVDARRMIDLLIDTGRRPDELCALPLDCVTRDEANKPVLIYTNSKSHRPGRRLPIAEATARIIADQQTDVRQRFPHTDPSELVLFPRDRRNPNGTKPVSEPVFSQMHRGFIDAIADQLVITVRGPDGKEHEERFDRYAVVPYAYRHSFAQRHADEGVAPDVLRDLMDHDSMQTTIGYYRVTEKRVRAAVDRVSTHQFDGQGRRVFQRIQGMLADAHARMRVGQVAVPFGICTEPSNVKASGQACPYKFTCVGCGHFRSDPSYLPELKSYLQQLLADRARIQAATDLQDWAKSQLTPRDEEIDQLRALIRGIEADVTDLSTEDQTRIQEAINVIRAARQTVNLGFPTIAPPAAGES
ncbi:site-specific integrase [Nocardia sp. NPDC004604]|uniref:tyrosine-type recombinase/integrase n=1 Tax=Nocardia sp. NPDC004604 TaxID=3157013 RepID=UPI0033BF7AF3